MADEKKEPEETTEEDDDFVSPPEPKEPLRDTDPADEPG
jgi:hypothetical protein